MAKTYDDMIAAQQVGTGRTPETTTIGDLIRAVLAVDNEADARAFYAGEVARIQAEIDAGTWRDINTAEGAARSNIGWCFGEGMRAERIAMWARVCGAVHPIFGQAHVSSEVAFAVGQVIGAGLRAEAEAKGEKRA